MRGQETLDAPLLPINECIFPDKWLNIPSCLVRAFEDDIKNQLYLERLAHNLGYKANKLEVKVSDQRRQIDKAIEERAGELKREFGRSLVDKETKLK